MTWPSDARGAAADHDASSRLPALDGLRAASIILVLLAHLAPLGPKPLMLNATAGPMGMSLFFVLSGFLIMRTLRGQDAGKAGASGPDAIPPMHVAHFAVRRLARLLPLAWLYVLVVALIHPMTPGMLLGSLALILNYRPDLMLPVTEHLWSLGVEAHFYAMAALLALAGRRALLLVWPLCIGVTLWRVAEGAHLAIATHLRVDEILIGACIATLSDARLSRVRAGPALFWLATAMLALSSHPATGALQFLRPYFAGLVLCVALGQREGHVRAALASAPARYVATISYALYVIHPLTAHGWWNAGTLAERYLLKRPLGLAITVVLAHLSTVWWERFWIEAARRWTRRHALNARTAPDVRPADREAAAPGPVAPDQGAPRPARADPAGAAAAASPSAHPPAAG